MEYGIPAPGFRLPDDAHIGRVRLRVSEVARSTLFYERVVGLTVLERSETSALLGTGDVVLVELHAGATTPLPARHLGLYHFAILVPDRAALGNSLRRLLELGVNPGAADHLVSEALYISDPDGLGIEIYRDRPRSEWRTNGKQLAMASDPLDFNGVLSASSDPTAQMPAGTTIGHVHLHVADLETARAFYHEKLGLDVMVWSYPGALFLSAGGYHHHLGLNTWAGPSALPPDSTQPRLLDWELRAGSGLEGMEGEHVDPWGTVIRLATSPK